MNLLNLRLKHFIEIINEANLKNRPFVRVMSGAEDKQHKVVGSNYHLNRKSLDRLITFQ